MDTYNDLWEKRFRLNMGRINGLIKLVFSDIEPLRATEPLKSEGARADILRTIVVFLHATFEDVLRTMARQRIATAQSEVLENIPLVGSGRPEKFHLGALNLHRDKTVDQLIHESVESYLDRETFGSCANVDKVLTQMGLDTEPFKPLYSDLSQMMKSRHRIVHEADLRSAKDSISSPWTFVDDLNLCVWLLVVLIFYAQLCVSIDPASELRRWYLANRLEAIKLVHQARAEFLTLRNQPDELRRTTLQNVKKNLAN